MPVGGYKQSGIDVAACKRCCTTPRPRPFKSSWANSSVFLTPSDLHLRTHEENNELKNHSGIRLHHHWRRQCGQCIGRALDRGRHTRVLLLEAGLPDYRLDFRTQMPAALAMPLQGTTYNWSYKTDPEPYMNNRVMDCGRGKGLGGSSLINGMCYIRGNALDFDHWAKIDGLADWTYADCLPISNNPARDGANDYHGGDE